MKPLIVNKSSEHPKAMNCYVKNVNIIRKQFYSTVRHYMLDVIGINNKLEFGMYPQSMPTEWTHVRTVRAWQSVRLDL